MTNFVKLSDLKNRRGQFNHLESESMAEVKGGVIAVICTGNYFTCKYKTKCPYNRIYCMQIPLYGIQN